MTIVVCCCCPTLTLVKDLEGCGHSKVLEPHEEHPKNRFVMKHKFCRENITLSHLKYKLHETKKTIII